VRGMSCGGSSVCKEHEGLGPRVHESQSRFRRTPKEQEMLISSLGLQPREKRRTTYDGGTKTKTRDHNRSYFTFALPDNTGGEKLVVSRGCWSNRLASSPTIQEVKPVPVKKAPRESQQRKGKEGTSAKTIPGEAHNREGKIVSGQTR